MRYLSIIIVCCALSTGCSSTRDAVPVAANREVINGYAGTVEVPDGFTHSRDQGIDSIVGHFTSADGRLVIHYDIGRLAGVYATQTEGKDIVSSSETTVHGLTALIVVARWKGVNHAIISFPEGGPANFYAELRDDADFEMVKKLALTFRLKPDEYKR